MRKLPQKNPVLLERRKHFRARYVYFSKVEWPDGSTIQPYLSMAHLDNRQAETADRMLSIPPIVTELRLPFHYLKDKDH